MRWWRWLGLPLLVALLAGCSSKPTTAGSPSPTAGVSAPPSPSLSPSLSPSPSSGATPSPSSGRAIGSAPPASASAPASGGAPQNLTVTDALRAELLQVGAASHHLTVSDYTGLAPGMTYYALDRGTGISWAGAALVPSAGSVPAQVANQDDGAYLLFEKSPGGQWKAYDDGYGAAPGSGCPAPLPPAIIALWHWDAATCHPAT